MRNKRLYFCNALAIFVLKKCFSLCHCCYIFGDIDCMFPWEWMRWFNVNGLMSHLTHNRLFQGQHAFLCDNKHLLTFTEIAYLVSWNSFGYLIVMVNLISNYLLVQFVPDEYRDQQKQPIPIPKHLRVAPAPDIHDCVRVHPSTKPIPKTTSSEIGWRSSEQHLQLDKYGNYCRPKGNLMKQLKWPDEAAG